jgi:hypothetical protein
MIEPQIHNGQRGVIGQQHGLQRLTETLDALTRGQTAQQQRDTQIQTQLTGQTSRLTHMGCWLRWQLYGLVGLAGLTLALGGLVGWQVTHRPELGYARALGTLDATLVQQWGSLPKPVQEQLSATYGRLGLVPPNQRN